MFSASMKKVTFVFWHATRSQVCPVAQISMASCTYMPPVDLLLGTPSSPLTFLDSDFLPPPCAQTLCSTLFLSFLGVVICFHSLVRKHCFCVCVLLCRAGCPSRTSNFERTLWPCALPLMQNVTFVFFLHANHLTQVFSLCAALWRSAHTCFQLTHSLAPLAALFISGRGVQGMFPPPGTSTTCKFSKVRCSIFSMARWTHQSTRVTSLTLPRETWKDPPRWLSRCLQQ